jgi:hypothetical protein
MKFFQYSGNCHLNRVLKTSAHPSISLVVLLLVTIIIVPSFASAEVRKELNIITISIVLLLNVGCMTTADDALKNIDLSKKKDKDCVRQCVNSYSQCLSKLALATVPR